MKEPCVHRWVLGETRGGVTEGRCRLCGAERTFRPREPRGSWDTSWRRKIEITQRAAEMEP